MSDSPKTGKCQNENKEGFRWHIHDCPNMKPDPNDKSMSREYYKCDVCGLTDSLDYDEMR